MKLDFITFMVRDIEASITFYQELAGQHIVRRFNPGQGEIVFMANDEGETMLEFIEFEHGEKVSGKGMAMSFGSQLPLEELRKKAISLGYTPSEIISQGPKPDYVKVPDPDGIMVEFSIGEV